MIMASILVGTVVAIVSGATGLIAGHGLLAAMGWYVVGGMAGVVLTLAVSALRHLTRSKPEEHLALATAQV